MLIIEIKDCKVLESKVAQLTALVVRYFVIIIIIIIISFSCYLRIYIWGSTLYEEKHAGFMYA